MCAFLSPLLPPWFSISGQGRGLFLPWLVRSRRTPKEKCCKDGGLTPGKRSRASLVFLLVPHSFFPFRKSLSIRGLPPQRTSPFSCSHQNPGPLSSAIRFFPSIYVSPLMPPLLRVDTLLTPAPQHT